VTYRGVTAPVQVIDLPGGNKRFAQFQFGLDSDLPPLKLKSDFGSLPAKKAVLIEASLDGLDWKDVREAWLHVRTGDGLWRRYQVTVEEGPRGALLVGALPAGCGGAGHSRALVHECGDEPGRRLLHRAAALDALSRTGTCGPVHVVGGAVRFVHGAWILIVREPAPWRGPVRLARGTPLAVTPGHGCPPRIPCRARALARARARRSVERRVHVRGRSERLRVAGAPARGAGHTRTRPVRRRARARGAHQARLGSAPLATGGADRDVWRIVARLESPPLREADAPTAAVRVLAASPPLVLGTAIAPATAAGLDGRVGRHRRVPRAAGTSERTALARRVRRCERGTRLGKLRQRSSVHGLRTPGTRSRHGARAAGDARASRDRARAGECALARGARARHAAAARRPERDGHRNGCRAAGLGLVHLLALSGLHVTWLAGVARSLVAIAGGGPVARAVGGALAALGYALIAGPIPSLARAVAAEAADALAASRERALDPLQSLGLAALVLLAAEPGWAFDLGFQLSCAATFGLVALGGPLSALAEHAPQLARRSLAAGAHRGCPTGALPWLLARFHALPWTSLVANLLAVPVSEGLLAAAALGAVCEAVLPGSGRVWMRACEALAGAVAPVDRSLGCVAGCAAGYRTRQRAGGPRGHGCRAGRALVATAARARLARPR
jgi:ComEC/Rec2-related protein